MKSLIIEGTDDTAQVTLNKESGIFEMVGRSLPEDSAEFFKPVFEWIEKYKKDPSPTTEFVFRLDYFNTASSKFIQDILVALEDIKGIKIVWYYLKEDEDMEEKGREFSELVEIPFELKTID
jgi:hypothetical protein